MATKGWIEHDGRGRPVPIGTLVDVRHFTGDVTTNVRAGQFAIAPDCTRIPLGNHWNGWVWDDGGPKPPKFKAYRLCADEAKEQSVAKFRHLLISKPAREGVHHGD